MGQVRFTSRINQWTLGTEKKLDFAVLDMATDIHKTSARLAPKDKRALVNSGRIERVGIAHYKIIYGGGAVPYGRIQELGGTIRPKRAERLVWKDKSGAWHSAKSVTIKGTHYLEKGGDAAGRNVKRYLRGII